METVLQNDFSKHSGEKVTLVSDASIHLKNDAASSAWQLCAKRDRKRRVSQPLEQQAHSYSYRRELETFHVVLQDADKQLKKPHHIKQHMDCEAAIKALARPSCKPGHTMVIDADLIMA